MRLVQTLNQIIPGESAIIARVKGKDMMRRRLMDLGLVPGTRIKSLRYSLWGDPVAYAVRGAVIALRQEESCEIEVIPWLSTMDNKCLVF